MEQSSALFNQILDTAIELAEETSWEKLHLHEVAARLGRPLTDIHTYFAQKDDLVEAWYDRADQAMLCISEAADFASWSTEERLYNLIMAWLDFLASHKRVSQDMLLYKLEPAHLHLQLQGLLRISRTVQWLREAARLSTTHLQRIVEEVGLTSIYLMTFVYWMTDRSEGQVKTREFLARRLRGAGKCAAVFTNNRPAYPDRETAQASETAN